MLKFVLAAALTVVSFQTTVDAAEQHRLTVRYGDLDLSSSDGLSRLDRRISRTVHQFCDHSAAYPNLTARIEQNDCQAKVRAALEDGRAVAVARAADRRFLAANNH